MKSIKTLLLFCFFAHTAMSQSLLKDINTTTASTYFGSTTAVLNGMAFFGADAMDGLGNELWKSDGSAGGTVLLKDVFPGEEGASPANFLTLTNRFLFTAIDQPFSLTKIFSSDGTAAGTLPLLLNNQPVVGERFVQANGQVYFATSRQDSRTAIVRTDGTPQGTVELAVTEPYVGLIEDPVIVGNVVYYITTTSDLILTLMRTDGTPQGTYPLKSIAQQYGMFGLAAAGATIYFWLDTGTEGFVLWKSDGSVAGTTALVDLEPGQAGGTPITWASTDDYLFFIKDSGAGHVCWRTDGTAAGTIPISQVIPYAYDIFIDGATVYVAAFSLYTSSLDGPLLPILNMDQGVQTVNLTTRLSLNGKVYFLATDAVHGEEIWVSDGTAAGTALVQDINPGPADAEAKPAFVLNNRVYWVAFNPLYGSELWATDPAGQTMQLAVDINTKTNSSEWGGGFATFGSVTLFAADNGTTGVELWRHFPGNNTVSNMEIQPGPAGSSPGFFTRLDNQVVFQATDSLHGAELWGYDLPNNQVSLLADLNPGMASAYPEKLTLCADKLLFNAPFVSDNMVYATDGSPAGTTAIGTYPDFGFNSPVCLQNDLLFSTANADLFKVNSASNSITLVKDFDVSVGFGSIPFVMEVNNRVVLSAPDLVHGQELWVSDGTPNGTVLLYDLIPGPESARIQNIKVVDDQLYFTVVNAAYGTDLWKTDGTVSGTVKIITLSPLNPILLFGGFQSANGLLYFMVGNSTGPYVSLWRSDGTAAGTFNFHNLNRSIYDTELFPAGDHVYFNGYDPDHGAELWITDGTSAGTRFVSDICPGVCDGNPRNFALSDSLLYFTAYYPLYGREPWTMKTGTTSVPPLDSKVLSMNILGNPAQAGSSIKINLRVGDTVSTAFHLYDLTGRMVWQKVESSQAGDNGYEFLLPFLPPGIYCLQATAGSERVVGKVMIGR